MTNFARCFTFWQDPRPADREAVISQAHGLDQPDVLPPLVVAVAGHLAVGAVLDLALVGGEGVPDARALAAFVPAALNLIDS